MENDQLCDAVTNPVTSSSATANIIVIRAEAGSDSAQGDQV